MNPQEEQPTEKKQAFYCCLVCTFIYLALFFPSFYVLLLKQNLYQSPGITTAIGLAIIFLSLCVPLSIVVALGLMWHFYLEGSFKAMYVSCFVPFLAALTALMLMSIIEKIFL